MGIRGRSSALTGATFVRIVACTAALLPTIWPVTNAEEQAPADTPALVFHGKDYHLRHSENGHDLYTPKGQDHLSWTDMITFARVPGLQSMENMLAIAAEPLMPARHLGSLVGMNKKQDAESGAAVFYFFYEIQSSALSEFSIARFHLSDQTAKFAVYSRRFVGDAAELQYRAWRAAHTEAVTKAFMGWDPPR